VITWSNDAYHVHIHLIYDGEFSISGCGARPTVERKTPDPPRGKALGSLDRRGRGWLDPGQYHRSRDALCAGGSGVPARSTLLATGNGGGRLDEPDGGRRQVD
jgi:hypothetical protein